MIRRLLFALACFVLLVGLPAFADTRVTLSRDAVNMGESVVLTIETDQPVASPDLALLRKDFAVGKIDSARQIGFDGNGVSASQQLRITLKPLRSGMLTIPALAIGNQKTAPLMLEVVAAGGAGSMAPARASTASTQADGPVFIDTVIDDPTPYVQQAVGVTVRLHYAINLFNGEFRQPEPPEGASLQPMGSDSRSMRVIDGRQYQVLERHYLLVPERSGALRLPGSSFSGEGESGFFDGLFGNGREAVSAEAPARTLQVKPIPASAGRPWLPARQVTLRVAQPASTARAGEAFDVVVELRADGVTASQLPELQLTAEGAQVFADAASPTDTFANGRPNAVISRRFSIVPQSVGTLRLQVTPVEWWDVAADAGRRAILAPMMVQVSPGLGRYAASNAGASNVNANSSEVVETKSDRRRSRLPWIISIGMLWLMLLLALIVWASRLRSPRDRGNDAVSTNALTSMTSMTSTRLANANQAATPRPALPREAKHAAHRHLAEFRQAVKTGDLATIARTLPALSDPPAHSLAEAREHLNDPAQIDAVAQLERALWGDGDVEAARIAIAQAFAKGPSWKPPPAASKPLLPPLYPER